MYEICVWSIKRLETRCWFSLWKAWNQLPSLVTRQDCRCAANPLSDSVKNMSWSFSNMLKTVCIKVHRTQYLWSLLWWTPEAGWHEMSWNLLCYRHLKSYCMLSTNSPLKWNLRSLSLWYIQCGSTTKAPLRNNVMPWWDFEDWNWGSVSSSYKTIKLITSPCISSYIHMLS